MKGKNDKQFMRSPYVSTGEDIECCNNDFVLEDENKVNLGKLGFGTRVSHFKTKIPYVIVNLNKEKIEENKIQWKINKMLDFMYKVDTPFMYRLLNHYEEGEHIFLIFEKTNGKTLSQIIQSSILTEYDIFIILKQILLGVKYLQENNVLNITVTPESILFEGIPKLTDYNIKLSSHNQMDKSLRAVMPLTLKRETIYVTHYTSPEELSAFKNETRPVFTSKKDSWNLGILLYEMLTNFQSPFKTESLDVMVEDIINCNPDISLIKEPFFKELISQLLIVDPSERMSVDDILSLPEISNIKIGDLDINKNDCIINKRNEYAEGTQFDSSIIDSLKYENKFLKDKLKLLELSSGPLSSISENNSLLHRSLTAIKFGDYSHLNKEENIDNEYENENSNANNSIEEFMKTQNKAVGNEDNDLRKTLQGFNEQFYINNMDDHESRALEKKNIFIMMELNECKLKIKDLEKKCQTLQTEKENYEKEPIKILDSLSSEKHPITDDRVKETIINWMKLVHKSKNDFNKSIEELINRSKEESEEYDKGYRDYIDRKQNEFYDKLDDLQKEDKEKQLKRAEMWTHNNQKVNDDQVGEEEFKKLLEKKLEYVKLKAINENKEIEIKLLEDRLSNYNEEISILQGFNKEYDREIENMKKEKETLELNLSYAKNFILTHCTDDEKEEFFSNN